VRKTKERRAPAIRHAVVLAARKVGIRTLSFCADVVRKALSA
jgi:hypothetical protein